MLISQGRFRSRIRAVLTSAAIVLPALAVTATSPITASASTTREISASGSAVISAPPAGLIGTGLQAPEFDTRGAGASDSAPSAYAGSIGLSGRGGNQGDNGGNGEGDRSAPAAKVALSFDGLNHYLQRTANGGNQYSLVPPDQGLCVGNGFVLETVNDVLNVYDRSGHSLLGVTDLNTFYGYPAAVDRTVVPAVRGLYNVTDPSCYFDTQTQRWFHIVLTYEGRGRFDGPNHLDIAVSKTSSPLGAWLVYRLQVQDDGTNGTPDHGCSTGNDAQGTLTGHGPCLGDYPHLGADANGFYITTNEYSIFGNEFHGAQVYAFSKRALAANEALIRVTQFDLGTADHGRAGFTLAPTTSPAGQYDRSSGGTEHFLSSNAADEANASHGIFVGPRTSTQVIEWSLGNTRSLNGNNPELTLDHSYVRVPRYGAPPLSNQKPGNYPLGQLLGDAEPTPDSNDTRMLQATYQGGKVWAALDTALTLNGVNKAGIEWFIVRPGHGGEGDGAELSKTGYFGVANNNVTYPTIGVNGSGQGVMAFTLLGADYYPSSAFATISADRGTGPLQIAALGLGPDDGFSSYKQLVSSVRPRWGDYGATAVDGSSIWIASEYVGQTCTVAQFSADSTCNKTRTLNANWGTRVSRITFTDEQG